MSHFISRCCW